MKHNLIEPSESTLAETEFAAWMKVNRKRIAQPEHYEIRPCKRVRGFMLRLPGIGWKLWFPSAPDAMTFARRVASCYVAECFVYDLAGQKID